MMNHLFLKDEGRIGKSRAHLLYIRCGRSILAQHQFDRTVVAAENIAMNARRLEAVVQTLGSNEVVNAPPGVLFTGLETITPPRVCAFCIGVEETEGIRESTFEQFGELRTLLIGKSRILAV